MFTILISGRQGSGKTTTARELRKVLQDKGKQVAYYRFAQPIYEMHDACLQVLQKYGIKRGPKDGPLLQIIGTEYARTHIHPDVWVNCAKDFIERESKGEIPSDIVIIDDLRFKNEFNAFEGRDSLIVRLECPENVRKTRCSSWRENTNHPSEVDLDGWLFNMMIDTEHTTTEEAVAKIMTCLHDKGEV